MTVLRTPEERFDGLKDFNFEPNYFEVCHGEDKLRMHYLDENSSSKEVVLYCMGNHHGAICIEKLFRTLLKLGRG